MKQSHALQFHFEIACEQTVTNGVYRSFENIGVGSSERRELAAVIKNLNGSQLAWSLEPELPGGARLFAGNASGSTQCIRCITASGSTLKIRNRPLRRSQVTWYCNRMARKLRVQFPGAVYHVTFRGNSRAPIFGDDADHIRLTERVAESAEDFGLG